VKRGLRTGTRGEYLDPRNEVTGSLRKLHNGELHNLYSSPKIRTLKRRKVTLAGHVALIVLRKGEERRVFRVLVEPGGKRPLGRPRHTREGFI
jgi:hypothetical protein